MKPDDGRRIQPKHVVLDHSKALCIDGLFK